MNLAPTLLKMYRERCDCIRDDVRVHVSRIASRRGKFYSWRGYGTHGVIVNGW